MPQGDTRSTAAGRRGGTLRVGGAGAQSDEGPEVAHDEPELGFRVALRQRERRPPGCGPRRPATATSMCLSAALRDVVFNQLWQASRLPTIIVATQPASPQPELPSTS